MGSMGPAHRFCAAFVDLPVKQRTVLICELGRAIAKIFNCFIALDVPISAAGRIAHVAPHSKFQLD